MCFGAAKDSVAAITDGRADLGFVAIDPGRPLSFTSPYVLIEGVHVVADDSPSTPLTTWTASASGSA